MNSRAVPDVIAQLQVIFRETFFNDALIITEETTIFDIPEWDSLANVSIMNSVEKEFKVRFTADEIASIDSVAGFLAVISRA